MALLKLHDVCLRPQGRGLSLVLEAGRSLAIMGPAGAGKSHLMRCILGQERPARGSVKLEVDAAVADLQSTARRTTPQSIARKAGGGPTFISDALSAVRLWEDRFKPLRELSPGQLSACAVLEVLASPLKFLAIDGALDQLDPWALDGAMRLLRVRLAAGAAAVVSTNRPDIAVRFDLLVVVKDGEIRFSGTLDSLRRSGPPATVTVSTEDSPGARALTDPFEVLVRQVEGGLEFTAPEGQAVAAKLLLEGYGDVRLVQLREPSTEETLLALLG